MSQGHHEKMLEQEKTRPPRQRQKWADSPFQLCKGKCAGIVFLDGVCPELTEGKEKPILPCARKRLTRETLPQSLGAGSGQTRDGCAQQIAQLHDRVAPCPCRLLFGTDELARYQMFSRFAKTQSTGDVSCYSIIRPFGYVVPAKQDDSDAALEAALRGLIWNLSFFCQMHSAPVLYSFLGPLASRVVLSKHQKEVLANQASLKRSMAWRHSHDHVLFSAQEMHFLHELLCIEPEILHDRCIVLAVFRDEFGHMAASEGQRTLFAKVLQLLSKQQVPLVVVSPVPLLAPPGSLQSSSAPNERDSFRDAEQKLRFRSARQSIKKRAMSSFQELLQGEVFDLFIEALLLGFKRVF